MKKLMEVGRLRICLLCLSNLFFLLAITLSVVFFRALSIKQIVSRSSVQNCRVHLGCLSLCVFDMKSKNSRHESESAL